MSNRLATLIFTAILWIVPSQVSHGMHFGTGRRAHVDDELLNSTLAHIGLQQRINKIDQSVVTVLQQSGS